MISECKKEALALLKSRWNKFVGFLVVWGLFLCGYSTLYTIGLNSVFGQYIKGDLPNYSKTITEMILLIIGSTISVGLLGYSLNFVKRQEKLSDLFVAFRSFKSFFKFILLNILIGIKVFLWSLLFIVPGIIAIFRYSQANFILLENPDIKVSDSLKESSKIMKGHKLQYFGLSLSFIGWELLALIPLYIGLILVVLALYGSAFTIAIVGAILFVIGLIAMMYLLSYLYVTMTVYYLKISAKKTVDDLKITTENSQNSSDPISMG